MAASRNGEDLGRKLLKLKEQIDSEKSRRSELQGELKSIMKRLSDEFGISSLDEAKKKIDEQKEELENLELKINESIEKIEDLLDEN